MLVEIMHWSFGHLRQLILYWINKKQAETKKTKKESEDVTIIWIQVLIKGLVNSFNGRWTPYGLFNVEIWFIY